MIMKRLTPEQAFQAFKENREIYTLQVVDPNMTVMELIQREDLVMFEDTPTAQKKPVQSEEQRAEAEPAAGRTEATAAQNEPVAKKSKTARVDHDTIMEMHRQGWSVKHICDVLGCSDQTVRNHIARG